MALSPFLLPQDRAWRDDANKTSIHCIRFISADSIAACGTHIAQSEKMAFITAGRKVVRGQLVMLLLLLAVARRVAGQGIIGALFPCEEPGEDPDDTNPVDNFSCPIVTGALVCYNTSQLCDDVDFCAGGSDEGNNLVALECNNQRFVCSPGINIPTTSLCDGVRNCENGDDETTTLCENKCLIPYYGGCNYSQECITSEFDVNCGACLPGFVDNPLFANVAFPNEPPCLVEVGLERDTYNAAETDGTTEQICAVLLVDPADFINGTDGVFNAIRRDFGLMTDPVISIQITSSVLGTSDAAQASDFQVATLGATLTRGQTVACVQFTITDDIMVESDEVFGVELTTNSRFAVERVDRTMAVVTITDNDELVEAVYQPNLYTVNEMDGTAQVCVAIVSSSPANTILSGQSTVTPTFLSGGSATSGVDFGAVATPSVLTFSAGTPITTNAATSARGCFTFPITNDNLVEPVENILLGLTSPTGLIDSSALSSLATVNIDIDELAEFSLDMAAYSIDEDGGTLNVFAVLANSANLGTSIEVTVSTRASSPLSAVAPDDYASTSMVFVFTPANTNPMQLSISIVDDALLESDETFQVELTVNSALATAVAPSLSPVTIRDNEAVRLNVQLRSSSVVESVGNAIVDITPVDSIPGPSSLVLLVSTIDFGSAAGNADFTTLTNFPVTFPVGSMATMSVPIAIANDIFDEDSELFRVEVTSNDPRAMISGSPADVTILDDDNIIFGFTMATYSTTEGTGILSVTLELAAGSGRPLTTFTALVSTTPGTAVSPGDFVALVDEPVSFDALSMAGDTQTFTVTITNDQVPENQESFMLSVRTDTPGAVAVAPTATGVINDDDDIIVGLERIMYNVNEEMMPGVVEVCVEILSPGTIPRDVDVDLTTRDGTATAGMDYVAVSVTLSFLAGAVQGDTACVDISIINDNVLEINGENFFADISSSDAVVQTGFDTATITFMETNDGVVCNFESSGLSVEEEMTTVMPCILCNSNSFSPSTSVIIRVVSSGGTASSGSDFTAVAEDLTFTATNTRRCVDVDIAEDLIVENDETVILSASSTSLPTGVSIGNGMFTVTITDDDVLQTSIVVGGTPNEVPEDGGPAMVCAEVVNNGQLAPGIQAVINLATRDGSAGAPADYTSVSEDLTFTSSNTNQMLCVSIPIEDDDICEDSELFFVDLTSTDPNVSPTSPITTSVTITDNDVAQVALTNVDPSDFRNGAYQVTECADDSLMFDISITNAVTKGPGVSCDISVRTEDGSALAGSDYVALDTTCTLSTGVTECDFTIEILDDYTAEMDEYFSIILTSSDPTRCSISNDNITVRIIDDEDCDDENICGEFEMCEELMCPNNFTCIAEGVGDDPHFAVTLGSEKTLCYTVQGEHGFAFNLISNQKIYMNAMFVPDKDREEVTWLGTMGIVVNNGYKKSNTTKLRFEAVKNKIHVDDQMVLEARNIEKITIQNGKLMISEAPPVEGYKTPFVRIDLNDVELSFSIKFMTQHLDLYWHSTGQKTADSHGLIGQFFHRDVVLDVVRKILIIPGKEPVPVQRKPVWAFMEREAGDSSNFCWVAMNRGFQGEGLIDGSYFDYLVDDVLSTEFKFKKL